MSAPGVDPLPVVDLLRARLPAALAAGEVPGAAGWSLRDARTEHLFDRAVVTLVLTREGHSLRAHLFPPHALRDPCARSRRFDLYHLDDQLPDHEAPARALLAGLVDWLDRALGEAAEVTLHDPSASAAPAAPPEVADVVAGLTAGLPGALAEGGDLAGWSLVGVGVERFLFLYVPRFELARGKDALRVYLLPSGTEPLSHFRTARFDVVYDDDGRGSTYVRSHAALDALTAWLARAFPAPEAPPAPPPAPPRTPAEALARELAEGLSAALAEAALPELAGYSFSGAAVERFRDAEAPTLRLARDGRGIALRLLPSGAEPTAALRTDRFDLSYDDDADGTLFTRDHGALEALARWLGERFPAEGGARPKPRRRSAEGADEATRRAEAEAAAIDQALRQALAAGSLPELEGWSFEGVALEEFRDGDAATARLTKGAETLRVRLLAANPESGAHFRTERFDLLYDDADNALFARHHGPLEALTRWLAEAFPLDASEHARELARRRALRARQLRADDDLLALADALDAGVREAVSSGAVTLPEGWRFDGASVDQQQGVTSPAVRFVHGERPFVLRVLPTSSERAAFHRTARFDVLYDSEPGDWQLQDEPVARGFVAWLAAAFPGEPQPEAPAETPAPAPEGEPTAET